MSQICGIEYDSSCSSCCAVKGGNVVVRWNCIYRTFMENEVCQYRHIMDGSSSDEKSETSLNISMKDLNRNTEVVKVSPVFRFLYPLSEQCCISF